MKKIVKIEKRKEKFPVYDIMVEEAEHYILENGIVSHNSGLKYAANWMWIIGKSQEKENNELSGFTFTINIEKSRFVREKAKFPLTVHFSGGIDKYSGLFDLAVATGFILNPKQGWYCMPNSEKNFRKADAKPYLDTLMTDEKFKQAMHERYKYGSVVAITQEELSQEKLDETE